MSTSRHRLARGQRAAGVVLAGAVATPIVVLTRLAVVAVDVDMLVWPVLVWLVVAVAIGIAAALFTYGPSSRPAGVAGAVAGGGWLALVNTGDPPWVARLLVVAVAASVAAALLALPLMAGVTAHAADSSGHGGLTGIGVAIGSVGTAITVGAFGLAAWPQWQWASVSGGGGILLVVAGAVLLAPTSATSGTVGSTAAGSTTTGSTAAASTADCSAGDGSTADGRRAGDDVPFSGFPNRRRAPGDIEGRPAAQLTRPVLRVAAGLAPGLMPLAFAQMTGRFGVGERYGLLTVAGGGVLTLGLAGIGHWWHGLRARSPRAALRAMNAAVLVAAVGVAGASVSHTLIGTVAGWATALGCSGLAVVMAAQVTLTTSPDDEAGDIAFDLARQVALGAALGLVVSALDAATTRIGPHAIGGIAAVAAGWFVRRLDRSIPLADADLAARPVRLAESRALPPTTGAPNGVPPVLEGRLLSSGYRGVQALFDVTVRVYPGQAVALLGPNGAGKTTLLRSLAGLQPAWSGRVVAAGLDISGFDGPGRAELGIALVGPGAAVFEGLSVADNLAEFARGLDPTTARSRRAEVAAVFPRLVERAAQPAATLSGGERQMLALAKVIVRRPRVVLVDELTLGLAPIAVNALVPVLARLRDEGTALIIVEQSAHLALSLASYVYCLEKGALVYEAPSAKLLAQPDVLQRLFLEGAATALSRSGTAIVESGAET